VGFVDQLITSTYK